MTLCKATRGCARMQRRCHALKEPTHLGSIGLRLFRSQGGRGLLGERRTKRFGDTLAGEFAGRAALLAPEAASAAAFKLVLR